MAIQRSVTGIPAANVAQVQQDYLDDGAIVSTYKNQDGTWTVVATYP